MMVHTLYFPIFPAAKDEKYFSGNCVSDFCVIGGPPVLGSGLKSRVFFFRKQAFLCKEIIQQRKHCFGIYTYIFALLNIFGTSSRQGAVVTLILLRSVS